jgi:hypothetical protein
VTARLPDDGLNDALGLVEAWHRIDHLDEPREGGQEAAVIVPHMPAIEVALVLSKVLAVIRCSWDAGCGHPQCAERARDSFREWFTLTAMEGMDGQKGQEGCPGG